MTALSFLKGLAQNIRVHAHTTWLCARDPALGRPLRILALAIAGYALSPIDLIPDFIPIIGLLDDALLIPLGLWLFRRLTDPGLYSRNLDIAKATRDRPVSRIAAAAIVTVWIVAAIWLSWILGWPKYDRFHV